MITFDHVTKTYKAAANPALDDVSVTIDKGEFVFLIGPSGAGKSTFLQLLTQQQRPSAGTVTVADYTVGNLSGREVNRLRRLMGLVFQDFRLLPKKTVAENVAFTLEVLGKKRAVIDRAVPETLELVGLAGKANRYPQELSGGEQQRVAVARAYVNRPLILLADEPTGNLDPDMADEILQLLAAINKQGTTVVMSTHNVQAVDAMQRRVIALHNGKIVRDDAVGGYHAATTPPPPTGGNL
ncbi:cell division ATP-binding protein FtsE [Corynebacterium choanae]|uniref:Cell division ATP-binding protein FtsE n=1 Tax=Corynebacterium choanae TaxID=1862358 RepID=A0A3G6J4L4_9CORY|nr:cell division ATP-binding protein FtsE [Corynebacterium choanae]AZA12967.1 Cell division ATP-binding protein FtsE [Corynebacterium choanae]